MLTQKDANYKEMVESVGCVSGRLADIQSTDFSMDVGLDLNTNTNMNPITDLNTNTDMNPITDMNTNIDFTLHHNLNTKLDTNTDLTILSTCFNDDATEKRLRRTRLSPDSGRQRSLQPRNYSSKPFSIKRETGQIFGMEEGKGYSDDQPSHADSVNTNSNCNFHLDPTINPSTDLHSNSSINTLNSHLNPDTNLSSNHNKCTPIMANFEEWMKLVQENKINASNSWNFALIDYFHDMSVLKEGDGINFQKASFTLDGCVKIYTSRVDWVASETGKLLSGLAINDKKGGEREHEEDVENTTQTENTENRRETVNVEQPGFKRIKRHNGPDHTLAKSFTQLQAKKLDLELAVDSLFRKMCLEFNEGGAQSLLLNNLGIDRNGRIVFDGQVGDDDDEEVNYNNNRKDENDTDLSLFRKQFFQDVLGEAQPGNGQEMAPVVSLDGLEQLTLCPSLHVMEDMVKGLDGSDQDEGGEGRGWEDPVDMVDGSVVGLRDMQMLDQGNGIESTGLYDSMELTPPNDPNDPNDPTPAANDLDLDLKDIDSLSDTSSTTIEQDNFQNAQPGRHLSSLLKDSENIRAYFDETLTHNWAGPEHWKIRKVKQLARFHGPNTRHVNTRTASLEGGSGHKPKPLPFLIDFVGEEVYGNDIFAPGINIDLSKSKGKHKHKLPTDQHFSSKDLVKLFLKPVARVFGKEESGEELDQEFFAVSKRVNPGYEQVSDYGQVPDYDSGSDYGSAPDYEHMSDYTQPLDGPDPVPISDTAENSVTESLPNETLNGSWPYGGVRHRSEYMSYAKSAKRVDVKMLKENIWRVCGFDRDQSQNQGENQNQSRDQNQSHSEKVFLSDIMTGLKQLYGTNELRDISTSFCFISLLHLANEKGLVLESFNDEVLVTCCTCDTM